MIRLATVRLVTVRLVAVKVIAVKLATEGTPAAAKAPIIHFDAMPL